jgi:hypothetical protein
MRKSRTRPAFALQRGLTHGWIVHPVQRCGGRRHRGRTGGGRGIVPRRSPARPWSEAPVSLALRPDHLCEPRRRCCEEQRPVPHSAGRSASQKKVLGDDLSGGW